MRKIVILAAMLAFLVLLGPMPWPQEASPGLGLALSLPKGPLLLAEAAISASYRLEPEALNQGGASRISTTYGLRDSLGWPAYGYAASGSYRLYGGFVPETLLTVKAFIPVGFKAHPGGW